LENAELEHTKAHLALTVRQTSQQQVS